MTPMQIYMMGKFGVNLSPIKERQILDSPGNLCLMLNIDWFNPFDETQYSVGAVYLIVQNLP